MIVDPGIPDLSLTSDGYYISSYQFFLIGTSLPFEELGYGDPGILEPDLFVEAYPTLYDAAADIDAIGPSFNPNSVCSGPTNSP